MTKRQISAEIIADSIQPNGNRITTFVLIFPRIILAEFNTHRTFSRNSASSRAIPFNKMLESVETDPFVPIRWMKDHSGMQGNEYFEDAESQHILGNNWDAAKQYALISATNLNRHNLTKQICNRVIEPFLWHKVIVTATEWENFFALRANDAAEIHIQELAYKMLDAYNESVPKPVEMGGWHIPFGDRMDESRIMEMVKSGKGGVIPSLYLENSEWVLRIKLKIATARCARVSYDNFDGTDDYDKDVELYDRLSKMGHWSPFEHCASATPDNAKGNFRGWEQLRHLSPHENKTDDRVVKKTWIESVDYWNTSGKK